MSARTALLLALLTAWFCSPDLALSWGVDTSAVQYRADGIFGAALALLARESGAAIWRAICDLAAVLWVMHPVCDIYMPIGGVQTASICDDASGFPGSAIVLCLIAPAAGWMLDKLRSSRG